MNKSNWVNLLLDGSLPEEEIIRLLELSYDLTKPARLSRLMMRFSRREM